MSEVDRAKVIEDLKWKKFPVLDDGHVCLVDVMGSDAEICDAARVSYGAGTKSVSDDETLIRYLMRHRHTTPLEMAEIKLRIRVPMDCWRQWIRHRTASVNEYSTRYSEAIDSQQRTEPTEWRNQSSTNKQGSGDYIPTKGVPGSHYPIGGEELTAHETEFLLHADRLYRSRLIAGVAREQARKDLPLSTYTEAYWKCDLHNVLHFLGLRMDSHAQKEIREYANILGEEIVAPLFPAVWRAFKDYRLDAMHLTRLDIQALALMQAQYRWEDVASIFTNKREYSEFRDKATKLGHVVPVL